MSKIEGFTEVDRAEMANHEVYGAPFSLEYAQEKGWDEAQIRAHLLLCARRTMDRLGVPEPRRLICFYESTFQGKSALCVQCCDSESVSPSAV